MDRSKSGGKRPCPRGFENHGLDLGRSSISSRVENTLTLDWSFNFTSSDQIGRSNFSASAKYSISLRCGDTSLASGILSENPPMEEI